MATVNCISSPIYAGPTPQGNPLLVAKNRSDNNISYAISTPLSSRPESYEARGMYTEVHCGGRLYKLTSVYRSYSSFIAFGELLEGPFMTRAIFVMSTGRVSTQFLANLLKNGDSNTVVVHEGAGPHYKPAQVFRGSNFEACLSKTPILQDHLNEIDCILTSGKSFIDTGWPTFAWIPYLSKRFESSFRFLHLVRDPYSVSASLNSHNIFEMGGGMFRTHGIITPELPNVKYPEFQNDFLQFNPFEKGLYHWLEVNRYIFDNHYRETFLNLYRFEDLYSGDNSILQQLWTECGFDYDKFEPIPPFDKYQRVAQQKLVCRNESLHSEVLKLAQELGYDPNYLKEVSSPDSLQQRYSIKRFGQST
jgi:hypothetical protein